MSALVAATPALVFIGLVLTAAFKDAASLTIPNWISLTLVGVFPFAALSIGMQLPAMGLNAGVGAAALAAGMAMFALGWVGGGDAKLLAAVSLWIGWPAIMTFLTVTALAGGGLAALLLILRSDQLRSLVLLGPPWMLRLAEPGAGVPYGVAIGAGAIVTLPATLFGAGLGL